VPEGILGIGTAPTYDSEHSRALDVEATMDLDGREDEETAARRDVDLDGLMSLEMHSKLALLKSLKLLLLFQSGAAQPAVAQLQQPGSRSVHPQYFYFLASNASPDAITRCLAPAP
jgi:hypothetical protein